MSDNSIFTDDEKEILELTKKVRIDALKSLTKNGSPVKTNELRILNEISTSLDKVVQDSASNRLKSEDVKNSSATVDLVRETLLNAQKIKSKMTMNTVRELDSNFKLEHIVPGHTDINPGKLEPSEFIDINDGDAK